MTKPNTKIKINIYRNIIKMTIANNKIPKIYTEIKKKKKIKEKKYE